MEITNIKSSFIIFGDFTSMEAKEGRLQSVFNDYEFRKGTEHVGEATHPAYSFKKSNHNITMRVNRIDIDYGFVAEEDYTKFMDYVGTVIDDLATLFTCQMNRISYVSVEFAHDDDQSMVEKCNAVFGINKAFGNGNCEFQLRINPVKMVAGEKMNSILLVQDGKVTNNATKESHHAMFINKDINTVITSTTPRFKLDSKELKKYIQEMINEGIRQSNAFLAALN